MVFKGMVYKGKYWISEKIRVYQCPFSDIFKGIFYASTQIMKWLRVVIRVPTSTHSNGLRRVISTDKIQSNPWVAVDLFEGKNTCKKPSHVSPNALIPKS